MSTNNPKNRINFGIAPTEVLENVFFDTADPNTAGTIFDPNVPTDKDKLYISQEDGSTWIWNGTAYVNNDAIIDISKVGDCARLYQATSGLATIANTVVDVIRMDKTLYQYGSTVVSVPNVFAFRLLKGYRYRIEGVIYGTGNAVNSVPNVAFYTATTGAYSRHPNSPSNWIIPANFAANNATQSYLITMEIDCLVDTAVRMYTTGTGGGTYTQASDGSSYMTALNIGVL
jgi:hypothetical protein